VRAPSEDCERLAAQLGDLAARLRAAEDGEVIYSKADVDKIVSDRLARERKKIRALEREAIELRAKLEAREGSASEEHRDGLGGLLKEMDRSTPPETREGGV
jgi:hypothetical protein